MGGHHNFGSAAVCALADSLKDDRTLLELNLIGGVHSGEVLQHFAQMLKCNSTLECLRMRHPMAMCEHCEDCTGYCRCRCQHCLGYWAAASVAPNGFTMGTTVTTA